MNSGEFRCLFCVWNRGCWRALLETAEQKVSVSSSTMCLSFRIHCHTELGQCKFLWIQEVDWVRSQMTNPLWVMKSIKVKFAWGISGSQNDCGPKNIHWTYWLHLPRFFLFLRHFHLEIRLWAISSSSTDCLFFPLCSGSLLGFFLDSFKDLCLVFSVCLPFLNATSPG